MNYFTIAKCFSVHLVHKLEEKQENGLSQPHEECFIMPQPLVFVLSGRKHLTR